MCSRVCASERCQRCKHTIWYHSFNYSSKVFLFFSQCLQLPMLSTWAELVKWGDKKSESECLSQEGVGAHSVLCNEPLSLWLHELFSPHKCRCSARCPWLYKIPWGTLLSEVLNWNVPAWYVNKIAMCVAVCVHTIAAQLSITLCLSLDHFNQKHLFEK